MSVASDLCDALVVALNSPARKYTMQFQAERRAVPMVEADFRSLGTVKVYVLANTRKAERRVQRGVNAFRRTYKPVVVVQKKLTGSNSPAAQLAESDALQVLVEEIEHELEDVSPLDMNLLGFNEDQDADVYGIEALRRAGVFTVPITLEYTN